MKTKFILIGTTLMLVLSTNCWAVKKTVDMDPRPVSGEFNKRDLGIELMGWHGEFCDACPTLISHLGAMGIMISKCDYKVRLKNYGGKTFGSHVAKVKLSFYTLVPQKGAAPKLKTIVQEFGTSITSLEPGKSRIVFFHDVKKYPLVKGTKIKAELIPPWGDSNSANNIKYAIIK